jgi:DNA topoisomerase-3
MLDGGTFFEAPGWPGLKLWKNAFGKTFAAADYVAVLQGWKDGAPIDVTGLVSAKSGKPYTAKIILEEATSKLKLDFGVAPTSPPAAPTPAPAPDAPAG